MKTNYGNRITIITQSKSKTQITRSVHCKSIVLMLNIMGHDMILKHMHIFDGLYLPKCKHWKQPSFQIPVQISF